MPLSAVTGMIGGVTGMMSGVTGVLAPDEGFGAETEIAQTLSQYQCGHGIMSRRSLIKICIYHRDKQAGHDSNDQLQTFTDDKPTVMDFDGSGYWVSNLNSIQY